MSVLTFPDAEAVAIQVLLNDTAVTSLVDRRIYSRLPVRGTYPLITLFRVGGLPPVREYLDGASLQIDVWADNDKSEAKALTSQIARVARAALMNAEQSTVTLPDDSAAWITGVVDSLGQLWQPDAVTNNARYLFGVRMYLHAV